jgi:hypothetical protein
MAIQYEALAEIRAVGEKGPCETEHEEGCDDPIQDE